MLSLADCTGEALARLSVQAASPFLCLGVFHNRMVGLTMASRRVITGATRPLARCRILRRLDARISLAVSPFSRLCFRFLTVASCLLACQQMKVCSACPQFADEGLQLPLHDNASSTVFSN